MLPKSRRVSRSTFSVPCGSPKAPSSALTTFAPPGWKTKPPRSSTRLALPLQELRRRRAHALADEIGDRGGEDRAEAHRIDLPSHDAERVGPKMLAGRDDLRAHVLAAVGGDDETQRRRPRTAPSRRCCSWSVRRTRKASVQISTATSSTFDPGSARASRAASDRPDTPPAQPRPKTGTRWTSGRNPIVRCALPPATASRFPSRTPSPPCRSRRPAARQLSAALPRRRRVRRAFEIRLGALLPVLCPWNQSNGRTE